VLILLLKSVGFELDNKTLVSSVNKIEQIYHCQIYVSRF